jgi:hypothetical protein
VQLLPQLAHTRKNLQGGIAVVENALRECVIQRLQGEWRRDLWLNAGASLRGFFGQRSASAFSIAETSRNVIDELGRWHEFDALERSAMPAGLRRLGFNTSTSRSSGSLIHGRGFVAFASGGPRLLEQGH